MTQDHEVYIRRTIALAAAAREKGNHPFGALLVRNGEIVLEAENTVSTETDVTAHAELNLVRKGWAELDQDTLSECTLYTSTEPCAMCCGAIYWAGIPRVVFGCAAETLYRLTERWSAYPGLGDLRPRQPAGAGDRTGAGGRSPASPHWLLERITGSHLLSRYALK